jgi:hypothetical protein
VSASASVTADQHDDDNSNYSDSSEERERAAGAGGSRFGPKQPVRNRLTGQIFAFFDEDFHNEEDMESITVPLEGTRTAVGVQCVELKIKHQAIKRRR